MNGSRDRRKRLCWRSEKVNRQKIRVPIGTLLSLVGLFFYVFYYGKYYFVIGKTEVV